MFREVERIVLERWPEGGDEMKFRLIYDGELPPEVRAGADVKHRIRQQFHPQLRAWWHEAPALKGFTRPKPDGSVHVNLIADEYARHGFRFVPLVRIANRMACRIHMLILMRQEPFVFSGIGAGDLDNRVKTLLDGLRMPTHQKSELGAAAQSGPGADEDPFYCLVEDDKSIYEISVATDSLLAPPRADQKHRDVVAIIDVHVTSAARTEFAYMSEGMGLIKKP